MTSGTALQCLCSIKDNLYIRVTLHSNDMKTDFESLYFVDKIISRPKLQLMAQLLGGSYLFDFMLVLLVEELFCWRVHCQILSQCLVCFKDIFKQIGVWGERHVLLFDKAVILAKKRKDGLIQIKNVIKVFN